MPFCSILLEIMITSFPLLCAIAFNSKKRYTKFAAVRLGRAITIKRQSNTEKKPEPAMYKPNTKNEGKRLRLKTNAINKKVNGEVLLK